MTDNAFVRSFSFMLGALVLLTIFLLILAHFVGGVLDDDFAQDKQAAKDIEIAARIAPVGQLAIGEMVQTAAAASSPTEEVSGESVYQSSCAACHSTGAAGSPKLGESAAWSARIGQGIDVLVDHAVNGFNTMPAKGGNAALSDDEVRAAVEYIVSGSQ
ncbi:MAG: c-type cytochrome [Gammaproteobacteria bacterium]|nr:c-type cytochrome [Gammaproteobacteria bacterium]